MHLVSQSQETIYHGCIDHGTLGIPLTGYPVILRGMPRQKWFPGVIDTLGPIECGLEHGQLSLDGICSDRLARYCSIPPETDINLYPVRRQLGNGALLTEVTGEVLSGC